MVGSATAVFPVTVPGPTTAWARQARESREDIEDIKCIARRMLKAPFRPFIPSAQRTHDELAQIVAKKSIRLKTVRSRYDAFTTRSSHAWPAQGLYPANI
jgi:hypothetical protein